jgi:hypothetical protein
MMLKQNLRPEEIKRSKLLRFAPQFSQHISAGHFCAALFPSV